MWCSSATILILAVVIVSGDRYQGSCSFASSPTSTSERVAAQRFNRESHILVTVVVSAIVVAAAVVSTAVSTHARVIVPPTCRVLDDSIRRACRASRLLPASD